MRPKLREGDLCIFDPYNILNAKESRSNIQCVRIIKIRRVLGKQFIDCVDISNNMTITSIPRKYLFKADLNEPNVIIRNPLNIPMITKSDMDLLKTLAEKETDPTYKQAISFLYCKLSQYMVSEIYTNLFIPND